MAKNRVLLTEENAHRFTIDISDDEIDNIVSDIKVKLEDGALLVSSKTKTQKASLDSTKFILRRYLGVRPKNNKTNCQNFDKKTRRERLLERIAKSHMKREEKQSRLHPAK